MTTQTETTAPATDDIVTPVEAITALLLDAGHPDPDAWLTGVDPSVYNVTEASVQRFLINRYWRMQLQSLAEDTMDARYCLVDEQHIKTVDWLRIFKQGVLPCILKHQLPLTTTA